MDKYWPIYFSICGAAYVAGLALVLVRRDEFGKLYTGYARFILAPWRVVTFILSAGFLTFIAPYTGDPTWDYLDAIFMSILTFATAAWALGVIIRAARGMGPAWIVFPAACVWHFSASLSYDAYILFKLGHYPPTWATNMIASSYLYGMAGWMWNAEWSRPIGLHFAYSRADWPKPAAEADPYRPLWIALPIFAVVGFAVIYVFFLI